MEEFKFRKKHNHLKTLNSSKNKNANSSEPFITIIYKFSPYFDKFFDEERLENVFKEQRKTFKVPE